MVFIEHNYIIFQSIKQQVSEEQQKKIGINFVCLYCRAQGKITAPVLKLLGMHEYLDPLAANLKHASLASGTLSELNFQASLQ